MTITTSCTPSIMVALPPRAAHWAFPKSTLSRRVIELESRLGVRLIERTSRSFVMTDVGARAFYRHAKAMLIEAQAAEDSGDQPVGGAQRHRADDVLMLAWPVLSVGLISDFLDGLPRRLTSSNTRRTGPSTS